MVDLLDRIRAETKDFTLGGTGGTFDQGDRFLREPLLGRGPSLLGSKERIETSFESYVQNAYKRNGIVFACQVARLMPLSEARVLYQHMNDGLPGALFGGPGLAKLEHPWTNAGTGELFGRMEQDGSMAGNSYIAETKKGLRRLRPDWLTILTGIDGVFDPEASPWDLDAEVVGYIYHPRFGGRFGEPVLLTPDRVAHYSPIPDPEANWRGMSWLTPLIREIQADTLATKHKQMFFEHGATLQVVVSYDKSVKRTDFERYVQMFDEKHSGASNAYRTLHLGGGADATIVGADMKQLDFKATQGAGETRIAAAAGVGAIIARLSEGMQGSSLNEGNYQAAKRQFADMTLRPLWRGMVGALSKFGNVPKDARLWYDTRDVEFLKDDTKDAAEIFSANAKTIRTFTDAGFTAESAVAATISGDMSKLEHSGLFSVQLQRPGSTFTPTVRTPDPTSEGDQA